MNRLPALALVTFSCVLLLLILLESRGGPVEKAAVAIHPPFAAGDPSRPATVATPAATLQGWSGTILARPLFSPSRRPGQVAVASAELPRLAGIIIGPGGASAIFAGAGDTRAIIAGPGAHAGPYLVRAVGPAGVTVLGPDGLQLLRPAYGSDASRTSAVAEPAAPPAGASILDLLRARVQGGLRPGLPQLGGPLPIFPQNQGPQR